MTILVFGRSEPRREIPSCRRRLSRRLDAESAAVTTSDTHDVATLPKRTEKRRCRSARIDKAASPSFIDRQRDGLIDAIAIRDRKAL